MRAKQAWRYEESSVRAKLAWERGKRSGKQSKVSKFNGSKQRDGSMKIAMLGGAVDGMRVEAVLEQ